MFQIPEQMTLARALEATFGSWTGGDQFLLDQVAALNPPLLPPQPVVIRWCPFLQQCSAALVGALIDLLPSDASLGALKARLAAQANAEPWHFVRRKHPVINRSTLRALLPELVSGKSRVLTVRGDRTTGKSFTQRIIVEEAARQGQAFTPVYVEAFGAGSPRALTQAVLRRIEDDVSLAVPPPGPESGPTFYLKEFAEMIRDSALKKGAQWWVVIDDADANAEILSFLVELARVATVSDVHPNGFRLVLLAYPGAIPHGALEESLGELDEVDVRKFFSELWAGAPPEKIDRAVEESIKDLPSWSEGRLLTLKTNVSRILGIAP